MGYAPGAPEEAVRVGGVALGLVEGLQSKRALSYLRRLDHRLRPHASRPEVLVFRERARALTSG
ncbi:hypothetical protein ABZ234_03290 [Nocardiopsis sp. NPDC006198]|uniref:hypothetical protein n=1 Tax=Nocardiopsis sp. NPDC006198 TaxID=3154472 RepID=UPI0033AC97DE